MTEKDDLEYGMRGRRQMSEPMRWERDSEANCFFIMQGNRWVAAIRLNGEMFEEQQHALLDNWVKR